MCKWYTTARGCKYGASCSHAHGQHELQKDLRKREHRVEDVRERHMAVEARMHQAASTMESALNVLIASESPGADEVVVDGKRVPGAVVEVERPSSSAARSSIDISAVPSKAPSIVLSSTGPLPESDTTPVEQVENPAAVALGAKVKAPPPA